MGEPHACTSYFVRCSWTSNSNCAMEDVGQKVYVRDEEHEWLPADLLDRTDEGEQVRKL